MKECPACRRCFPDDVNHCPQDGDETTPSLLGEPILDARYQLEKRLGQGGMGVVFQARHIFLKTSHAIKVILPDLVGNDPMLVTRFRQEALAAAAIRHQNIIAVTDFGVVRGTMPFLVMEFVSGKSLHEMLAEEGAMPPERALELMSAIGAGVAAAHRQNIVHRDLKPLNIMAQDKMSIAEGLKILDFGLAKIKSGELLGSFVQAKTSGLMGSPFYMAPEQWSDEEPDSRADIYSMGIILYQMLAGDVPFKGSSIPSIMKKHLTLSPPSFKSVGVNVAPEIEAVVRHALEKEADARVPTVEALLAELRQAIGSLSGGTTTPIRVERVPTAGLDPNKTFASPLPPTTVSPGSGEQTDQSAFDSLAGTISSAGISEQVERQISQTAAKHRREEEEREAEARRVAAEREEREQQQREQLERVSRQASELEERLARLATSMPPPTTVMDPEVTHVHRDVITVPVGDNSLAGVQPELARSQPGYLEGRQKSKSSPLLMVGAGVLVLALVGGVGGYFLLKSKPVPTPAVQINDPATLPPTESLKPSLAQIPGGTFQMGRNVGPPQERPEHPVTVAAFLMDRTEVTNEEYAEFVRDTNYEAPSHWSRGKPLTGQERWPVVNVSSVDAQAFADWRSKRDGFTYRLPTEQEWEYAARNGGEHKRYPWGDVWADKRAVVNEATPRPVGSYPEGADRWGVVDLIGNVWEWTSSNASLYSGDAAQIPAVNREWVVARGGGYSSDPNDLQIPVSATYRDWYAPTWRQPNFGFRLVRSAQ